MSYHRSSVHSNGYSPDSYSGRDREESPSYLMEHLATFTVSKETGIVYPADGMRRLLQLEKTNGIWSQKMQLRLEDNMVLIIDNETGDIMEKFPAALIQEPTAFTSNDPMEIYNNILVFIVGDERQPNSHSEMHIFQCQMISAQELVKDLKQLRLGKSPGQRGGQIPPPPPTPPPEPPLNGVSVKDQVNAFNLVSQGDGRGSSDVIGTSHDDESSSTSSEKYGRDVTTLNHCFDDIEKFIARLQHSAAASRELERRKKNRKSKKKDMGDGLLTMRAKPPPEIEFIDIFQKFKLSFILLAKLKHHIHDPNAPELVHFLFTPLALIVDASHDTKYAPNLPAKVLSPLLTQEAINLLMNCVSSKETELWHSLGDAWLIPREKWKGKVPPYHPVFMDGWSPDYPVTEDIDERRELVMPIGTPISSKGLRDDEPPRPHESDMREVHYRERERERDDSHFNNEFDYDDRSYMPRDHRYSREERLDSQSPGDSEGGPPPPARSDISADSIERTGVGVNEKFERLQARWLEELRSSGAKVVQVTYPRTANNDKELSVIRGEYLQVLDDSRKWWKARNSRGEIAHVPHTIVTQYNPSDSDGFRGYYPSQEDGGVRGVRGGHVSGGGIPSPPIPPTPPNLVAPASADWVRKQRLDDKDKMLVELKDTLNLIQEKKPPVINKKKNVINITADSTPTQVQSWMRERGFDERGCKLVNGLNGLQLFSLSLEQCLSLGPQEGKRLHNQIILNRNLSQYKTVRSDELLKKLEIRRQKSEITNGN